MFDPNARASGGRLVYYDSPERFVDMAGRLFDAGFDEIGVYYPALESQLDVFESVATDVIPTLRAR